MPITDLIGRKVKISWTDNSDWNNYKILRWEADGWMKLKGLSQAGAKYEGQDMWIRDKEIELIEVES